uniref:Uncharacterized protein n=1 Tax=Rhizophora mucronata TaxID=61149 RepID=A0A2P2J0M8_RHIMU
MTWRPQVQIMKTTKNMHKIACI